MIEMALASEQFQAVVSNIREDLLLHTSFKLAHYRFTLEAQEPMMVSPVQGNALRGGLGHVLKRLACFQPKACFDRCQQSCDCPYGYIFETTPPPDSEALRNLSDIPRPFIIRTSLDRSGSIRVGDRLSFELILVGQGIKYLRYFIGAFQELTRQGLGKHRNRLRLVTVEALPCDDGMPQLVYDAQTEIFYPATEVLGMLNIMRHIAQWPLDRLTLEFVTPTRLKYQQGWIQEGPPFEILIRTLLSRISSLSYFHCGQLLDVDFRGLIDQAAEISIVKQETRWQDWTRFSGRQKRRIEMGGLVGRVTYSGKLNNYLPLLALGEFIHVGKGAVVGNGQIRVIMTQKGQP